VDYGALNNGLTWGRRLRTSGVSKMSLGLKKILRQFKRNLMIDVIGVFENHAIKII
jgi:hypothetical protein